MDTQAQKDRCFAELMRLAQEGDAVAYVRLLQQITPRLRDAVRRKRPFLQPPDVDDLVQTILLALHSVRMTYDPRRPFLPWLMAIARNQIADAARRHSRQAANKAGGGLPETFSLGGANTYSESYGDLDELRNAINDLSPGQRRAIEMLRLKEMSLKEAAVASGMSIAALKVAVHRAVRALRKALAGKA
jgi:RNA polymerase sigma-70 factor (ECF subfamily)